jgi:L-serine dehydratase
METTGTFAILKLAVGPSSSHTMGPFLAARDFRRQAMALPPPAGARVRVRLFGSLALTGRGHLTDLAVTAGLAGCELDAEPPPDLRAAAQEVRQHGRVLLGSAEAAFHPEADIEFDTAARELPHPNTLRIALIDAAGRIVTETEYRSVGGGRVAGGAFPPPPAAAPSADRPALGAIVDDCLERGIGLAEYVRDRERRLAGLDETAVYTRLERLWAAMTGAIDAGLAAEGILPGRLKLPRRAAEMFASFQRNIRQWRVLPQEVTLAAVYAIAVAEQNAAGGRVVTAPTCGSAGVVPAVLRMLQERFRLVDAQVHDALLVAALLGGVVAANASIAGAEVGCQGEVGTASAMAAAAACHLLGGTVLQVESAAEMALEHHLGLTCDPVHGLVQIPCIERNAVGAVTALNAANLALLSGGAHRISFDQVVATMRQVGLDMPAQYKETALGGLAAAAAPADGPPATA